MPLGDGYNCSRQSKFTRRAEQAACVVERTSSCSLNMFYVGGKHVPKLHDVDGACLIHVSPSEARSMGIALLCWYWHNKNEDTSTSGGSLRSPKNANEAVLALPSLFQTNTVTSEISQASTPFAFLSRGSRLALYSHCFIRSHMQYQYFKFTITI